MKAFFLFQARDFHDLSSCSASKYMWAHVCQGRSTPIISNIIGDGKNQPNSRGLYTHSKDSY